MNSTAPSHPNATGLMRRGDGSWRAVGVCAELSQSGLVCFALRTPNVPGDSNALPNNSARLTPEQLSFS